LRMTEYALPILRDQQSITLRMDTIKAAKSGPRVKILVSEEDAPLLSALKAKRRGLAETSGVPAYIVFNDKTLIDMAQRRPTNLDEMAGINGVGAKKLASYGDAFLEVITGEVERAHPNRRKLVVHQDGMLYDRLLEVQSELSRGLSGVDKPLSCSASLLARIAKRKPRGLQELSQILGEQKTNRFGTAFLDVLAQVL
jgi:ATP-dependent DNA helicase RecQ